MNKESMEIEYHPNGIIETEWCFIQMSTGERKVVSRKTWYANGLQKSEEYFKDGKQNGREVWWFENGQKSFECNFLNGKENGFWNRWWENGNLCEHRFYADGKIEQSVRWDYGSQRKIEDSMAVRINFSSRSV